MTIQIARGLRNRTFLPGAAFAVALLLAACGGASAAPTAAPASSAASSPASAGPATWADWIAHRGFGAQSGPNEVRRLTRYDMEHAGDATLFDLDENIARVTGILAWLDTHPAKACWADYHEQVRAYLVTVKDGWTKARPEVQAGHPIPADILAGTDVAANAANDLPRPTNCP
jgi:hypothetical protein